MRNKIGQWLYVAIIILTSGCASIVGDETQPVSVDTPSCPKASCRLTNSQGTYFVKSTPETIVINKAYSDLRITCERNGNTATSVHMSAANTAVFGNILLGGLPGLLIDGGTGAGYDYPGYLVNPLNCSDQVRQTTTAPVFTSRAASSISPIPPPPIVNDFQSNKIISKPNAPVAPVFQGTSAPRKSYANHSLNELQALANSGNPEGQFILGKKYFDGDGVSKDLDRAFYFLKASSNQQHAQAQMTLGIIYFYGWGGTIDLKQAKQFFELAWQNGAQDANFYLQKLNFL